MRTRLALLTVIVKNEDREFFGFPIEFVGFFPICFQIFLDLVLEMFNLCKYEDRDNDVCCICLFVYFFILLHFCVCLFVHLLSRNYANMKTELIMNVTNENNESECNKAKLWPRATTVNVRFISQLALRHTTRPSQAKPIKLYLSLYLYLYFSLDLYLSFYMSKRMNSRNIVYFGQDLQSGKVSLMGMGLNNRWRVMKQYASRIQNILLSCGGISD